MRIIIIGCGRVGSRLAQTLTLAGHSVTVVDKDPEPFNRLGNGFTGKTVLGVGFDQDVLLEAGIRRADGLAAVTSSDEANVITARIAREIFKVPKVVARLYDPGEAEIYSRLGLQTIAVVDWAAERIASLLLMSRLETTCNFGAGNVDLVTIETPHLLVGRTVEALTMPGEIQVVAITRGGSSFLPTRGTIFQEDDLVHIVVLTSSMNRLTEILNEQAGG